MGRKHSKEEILQAACAVTREQGLGRLSFGRVAKYLGITDRMVVYYFPRKEDLVSAVFEALSSDFQKLLAGAFTKTASNHIALCQAAWPVLSSKTNEALFALFFEATGLAAAGQQPFATLIPKVVSAWVDWVENFLDCEDKTVRRREAEATVALLDGLMLFRQTAGARAANRTAKQMGL